MALLSFWNSNPGGFTTLKIEQIVSLAGDGKLLDNSICSSELRDFFQQVSSDKLSEYVGQCLGSPFQKSGLVLQDLVNELGRRLDYTVTSGRYQGVAGAIGFDGIWSSSDGNDIIVEVKTTDAYRISLDTIAAYRDKLEMAEKTQPKTSVLVVVGREDTGELEAQVRGSRHAWDMRLISIDALATLVKLKESTEAGVTGEKIRSVLVPMEYTRLDALIDVMFATAKDVETTIESEATALTEADENLGTHTSDWQFTPPELVQVKRDKILVALSQRDGKKVIKRSRALYWDSTHTYRMVCTISKRYTKKGAAYWYAYHPNWDTFLGEAEVGNVVLGCVDVDIAFVIPVKIIREYLPGLNTTGKNDSSYWHLQIFEQESGKYALQLPKNGTWFSLNDYILATDA